MTDDSQNRRERTGRPTDRAGDGVSRRGLLRATCAAGTGLLLGGTVPTASAEGGCVTSLDPLECHTRDHSWVFDEEEDLGPSYYHDVRVDHAVTLIHHQVDGCLGASDDVVSHHFRLVGVSNLRYRQYGEWKRPYSYPYRDSTERWTLHGIPDLVETGFRIETERGHIDTARDGGKDDFYPVTAGRPQQSDNRVTDDWENIADIAKGILSANPYAGAVITGFGIANGILDAFGNDATGVDQLDRSWGPTQIGSGPDMAHHANFWVHVPQDADRIPIQVNSYCRSELETRHAVSGRWVFDNRLTARNGTVDCTEDDDTGGYDGGDGDDTGDDTGDDGGDSGGDDGGDSGGDDGGDGGGGGCTSGCFEYA